jgi:hypothetical protein
MGAIAEGLVAYAKPLLDQTDGSEEQLNKAFAISQLCFNLSLLPEDRQDQMISEMQSNLKMDDEEFDDFRRSIVVPMIRRHQEMFPLMHSRISTGFWQSGAAPISPPLGMRQRMAARAEAYPGTNRYAPCPCNSGRKYKFCCGKKRP